MTVILRGGRFSFFFMSAPFFQVKFRKLFAETADIFEALGGTLRAAKKRKIVSFAAEMLLQGRDDNVDIILLSGA